MKLLFASSNNLFDSTSGAALSVRTLLEELFRQGHECHVVCGSQTDGFTRAADFVQKYQPARSFGIGNRQRLNLTQFESSGVRYDYLQLHSSNGISEFAQTVVRNLVYEAIRDSKFDAFLTYGVSTLHSLLSLYAKHRGLYSMLYVPADGYSDWKDFAHVDAVVTNSSAITRRLADATSLPVTTLSAFVDVAEFENITATPKFISFINPSPSKGLMIAAELVRQCANLGRPYQFQFVEGRCSRDVYLRLCPWLRKCDNLQIVANQPNGLLNIYSKSKAIIFPSLRFEAAGRVLIEANACSIPVIASRIGGIEQTLNGAGLLIDVPDSISNDFSSVPDECIQQWLHALDSLHQDDVYDDAVRRAKNAADRYSLAELASRFAEAASAV